MVDEIANRPARPDVTAALAETAFASLARAGAPVVVAEGDPARVIHANPSALALFGVSDCDDLTRRLFDADDFAARRLSHLAQYILPGAAARLERISLHFDGLPETVTVMCRRTPGANPLFVLAGLGMRAGLPRAKPSPAAANPLVGPVATPPNVPAPPAPAESFIALKADLERRFPGLAPARFLWRTDAANVVTAITPPLAEIVGAGCANFIGRHFGETTKALGLDPRGELARALNGRATFSRIDLDWPIENVAAAAPVTLGALPAFDRSHGFEGWRGFGVIHLDALRELPAVVASLPSAAPFTAAGPELIAIESVEPEPDLPEAHASLDYSGVVVPLRPLAARQSSPAESPPAENKPAQAETNPDDASRRDEPSPAQDRRDGEDDSVLVTLAPHERNAFREIARTLGARGDASAPASEPPAAAHAPGAVPEASERLAGAPAATPVFVPEFADALPVGLAVARGGRTLFANRRLLDWLGYADFAAFDEAGGLRAACKGAPPEFVQSERRTLTLRPVARESFAVDAVRASILWEGAPADCLTLTRPSALALEQRVGVAETVLRQRETEADETLAILEAAADGFVLVNGDGVILGLNRPAESLFGYGRDQVAGESFTRLFAPESQAAALEVFARLKSGDLPGGREVTGRTRQGAALPLHLTLGRLGKSGAGKEGSSSAKYCAVLRDMSQWKKAEAALEEARSQAQRDSQAKSEFLAKVSHEIRTPLNAILGFAEVIMDERFGPVGNERYKEYLRDIHASGAHVMSLVNDLLDLSKIEAGRMDLAFAEVDANRVVAECVSLIQPQANRERVITRLALAPRLPAIIVDERSLRQIVLNLLANAVRYNEPGGQVIVSTALSDSGHAVLRVKDTGVGMSENDLRKAMEPFGQASPARAAGGTGLGLPLTKALVDANHAGLAIRSRKNEGTLVEVTFPLAPPAAEALPAAGKAG